MRKGTRLVWKVLATGELVDGAVPFLPPSRAVWAIPTENGWQEVSGMAAAAFARRIKRPIEALRLQRQGLTLKEIGVRIGQFKDPKIPVSYERARQMIVKAYLIERREKR